MLFSINVANATAIGGNKIFEDITVGEVLREPTFASYLTSGSYSINGITIRDEDYSKKLSEFGLYTDRQNYLVAVKNANGNR